MRVLAVLAIACSLVSSHAHPQFFADRYAPTSCGEHPKNGFGRRHGGSGALSEADPGITFDVKKVGADTGARATSVCPGASYRITITYPGDSIREGYLTASSGTFEGASGTCSSRTYSAPGQGSNPWSSDLTLPCYAPEEDQIRIKITSAASPLDTYKYASLSLPVDTSCPTPSEYCLGPDACGVLEKSHLHIMILKS